MTDYGWWLFRSVLMAISAIVSLGGYIWIAIYVQEWFLVGLVYWGLMAVISLLASAYIDSRS
jgi:hypothetical protein